MCGRHSCLHKELAARRPRLHHGARVDQAMLCRPWSRRRQVYGAGSRSQGDSQDETARGCRLGLGADHAGQKDCLASPVRNQREARSSGILGEGVARKLLDEAVQSDGGHFSRCSARNGHSQNWCVTLFFDFNKRKIKKKPPPFGFLVI